MANTQTQSIPREQFLTMSINLLHRAFVDATRTDAKKLFNTLAQGSAVALTNVQMEDKSTVRFDLALDHSEYDGSLNYGAFRASLVTLLGNLAGAIKEEREIQTFGDQSNADNMIFGITGVTVEREVPAVMVLSANIGGSDAGILLRLMYLDYKQFLASQQEEGSEQAS